MQLLDRLIAGRFATNFILVFAVMTLFAASIDTILQLDAYVEACRAAVEEGRFGSLWTAMPAAIIDYNLPRVFQFYAYLLGLCSVAAAGFTLVQMVRARELVATLSAGISLWRVALSIGVVAVGLNLLQLVSGELFLPRLAPLLVREHSSILAWSAKGFPVKILKDADGRLVLAQWFDPATESVSGLLVLERDESGAATRRIEAASAAWSAERGGWVLEGGIASGRSAGGPGETVDAGRQGIPPARIDRAEPVDFIATDVSPKVILSRRFRGFAQLLSSDQIGALADEGSIGRADATRLVGQRFAGAGVNLLMLAIAIPFFLVREPRKMLGPSVACAATTVPGLLLAFFLMTVSLPGVPATVGVFLPVALLLPIAAWRIGALRT